jgi:glutathione S-transferase
VKLYGTAAGANPRRVSIYLVEKGLKIERVNFLPPLREIKTPEFLAKNPAGKLPVLELDDGRCISESAAIVEFLEEMYPDPPMIGTTPVERAQVRSLERMGTDLFARLELSVQHSIPEFIESLGLTRYPDVIKAVEPSLNQGLGVLETRIGDKPFLAGDRCTVADCTLFALLHTCTTRFGYVLPDQFSRLHRWYGDFNRRPSATVE